MIIDKHTLIPEEDLTFRSLAIYSNDYFHGSRLDGIRLPAHINEGYGIGMGAGSVTNTMLGRWEEQRSDLSSHQAVLQSCDDILVQAPSSLTQMHNRNVIIKGITKAEHPAYNTNQTTYFNALGDALDQVPATVDGTLDVGMLNKINQAATSGTNGNLVRPLNAIKGDYFALLVHPSEIESLTDLSRSDSISSKWLTSFADEVTSLPWQRYMGNYKSLLIFEDQRAATLSITGSTGSWTGVYNYRRMGETDSRVTASGTKIFNTSLLLGESAIMCGQHQKPVYKTDSISYGTSVGTGVFAGKGYQARVFDAESGASATTLVNESSAVVFSYAFGGDL